MAKTQFEIVLAGIFLVLVSCVQESSTPVLPNLKRGAETSSLGPLYNEKITDEIFKLDQLSQKINPFLQKLEQKNGPLILRFNLESAGSILQSSFLSALRNLQSSQQEPSQVLMSHWEGVEQEFLALQTMMGLAKAVAESQKEVELLALLAEIQKSTQAIMSFRPSKVEFCKDSKNLCKEKMSLSPPWKGLVTGALAEITNLNVSLVEVRQSLQKCNQTVNLASGLLDLAMPVLEQSTKILKEAAGGTVTEFYWFARAKYSVERTFALQKVSIELARKLAKNGSRSCSGILTGIELLHTIPISCGDSAGSTSGPVSNTSSGGCIKDATIKLPVPTL